MIKKINDILNKYQDSLPEEKNVTKFSIFIGSTSSPIEALERGVNG